MQQFHTLYSNTISTYRKQLSECKFILSDVFDSCERSENVSVKCVQRVVVDVYKSNVCSSRS